MTEEQARDETVSLLQDLGLKEYEARCFLALTQVSTATAKEISERSEVPRTRVYDAVRVLESEGLVEVQHSSPQQYRAVDVDEAVTTLRRKYDDRLETLESYLDALDVDVEGERLEAVQEVWAMSGPDGIQTRTLDLVEEADAEILLLAVDEGLLTPTVLEALGEAIDRGVDVVVGGVSETAFDRLASDVPDASTFETDIQWLVAPRDQGEVAISRILLVDGEAVLVSSYYPGDGNEDTETEQAIYASGLTNGFVVLVRRVITTGLLGRDGPQD